MKKILIPVDFEKELDTVYEFVKKLADKQEVEVTLLHLVEYPVVPGNYLQPAEYISEFYQRFRDAKEVQLKELAGKPWFEKVKVVTEIVDEPGEVFPEILAAKAKDGNFDLVLLISRHRSGLDSLFVGSNLIRAVRQCPVPMIILSPDHVPTLNRIAYATDFSDASAEVYGELRKVGMLLDARIDVFYVNTMSEFKDQRTFVEERNQFMNKIGLVDLPEIACYNAWELETGILHCADDNAADFIAMATHGRRGLGALFINSLTENLINDTTYPIIVLNMRAMKGEGK